MAKKKTKKEIIDLLKALLEELKALRADLNQGNVKVTTR